MADFDPDKYLAEKTGGAPVEAAPAASEDPGIGQAMLKGVQNIPTFGFGDKIGAGLQAGLLSLSGDPSSFGENYDRALAENRRDDAAAREHQAAAYYGAGLVASAPLAALGQGEAFAGSKAANLVGKVLTPFSGNGLGSAIGNAAVQGGISGIGYDDTGDLGSKLGSAASGAGYGAATGGALGLLGPLAAKVPGALERLGIAQGHRAIMGVGNALSKKEGVSDDAVRRGLEEKLIPYFGSVKKIASNFEDAAAGAGEHQGNIVKQLEDSGIQGPNKPEMVDQRLAKLEALRHTGEVRPAVYGAHRDALEMLKHQVPTGSMERISGEMPAMSEPVPSGPRVAPATAPLPKSRGVSASQRVGPANISPMENTVPGRNARPAPAPAPAPAEAFADTVKRGAPESSAPENFSLSQAEKMKSAQQDLVDYNEPVGSAKNRANKEIAADYRQGVEDAISAGAKTPEQKALAEQFVPAKQRTGDLIEGRDFAKVAANRFANSSGWGMKDILGGGAVAAAGNAIVPGFGAALGIGVPLARRYAPGFIPRAAYGAGTTLGAAQGSMAKALGKVGTALGANPAVLGKYAGALMGAFQRGGNDGLAAAHFALSHDPGYQEMHATLPEGEHE